MSNLPSLLSLGTYQKDVRENINNYGGRLGLLKLLSKHDYIVDLLEKTGVTVNYFFSPTIISNKNSLGYGEYERIIHQCKIFSNIYNCYGGKIFDSKNNELKSLVGIPGDFIGLADNLSTPTTDDLSKEGINLLIEKVRESIQKIDFSNFENVYGIQNNHGNIDFSIGLIPKMETKIIVAKESANSNELFFDEFFTNNQLLLNNKTHNHNQTNSILIGQRKKIKSFLKKLKELNILDINIAYQIELGHLCTGELILINIKEISIKNSESDKTKTDFSQVIGDIIL